MCRQTNVGGNAGNAGTTSALFVVSRGEGRLMLQKVHCTCIHIRPEFLNPHRKKKVVIPLKGVCRFLLTDYNNCHRPATGIGTHCVPRFTGRLQ